MKKWRLEDREGNTLKIVEAVDHSAATIYGFKHFPGKYDRAVDVRVDEGVRNKLAGVVEHLFLQEGKTPTQSGSSSSRLWPSGCDQRPRRQSCPLPQLSGLLRLDPLRTPDLEV